MEIKVKDYYLHLQVYTGFNRVEAIKSMNEVILGFETSGIITEVGAIF